jgi:autotransporter adhesin
MAIGSTTTTASGDSSTAIGIGANATAQSALAVGNGAGATGAGAISIGGSTQAAGFESVSIGIISIANSAYSLAMGLFAGAGGGTTSPAFISIGTYSSGRGAGPYSVALGGSDVDQFNTKTSAVGGYSIAIGGGNGAIPGALANADLGVAVGSGSVAGGIRSVSIGTVAGDNPGPSNHRNTALGTEAGRSVNGAGNTGAGLAAGHTVVGDLNSALGNSSGQFVTGFSNTGAGVLSGTTVSGSGNSAFGNSSGMKLTGHQNVAVGAHAGKNVTASNTVAVGTLSSATVDYGAAIGSESVVSAGAAVALGRAARATRARAVAIGAGSLANVADTVSVGRAGSERRIMNVAPAVNPTDAVNLAQVQSLLSAAVVVGSVARPSALSPSTAAGDRKTNPTLATPAGFVLPPASRPEASRNTANAQSLADASASGNSAITTQSAGVREDALEPSTIVGWANVRHDGAVSSSRNIIGNTRHGIGEYEVAFKKSSLRQCTYNATLAGVGFISVKAGPLPNSLKVETRNHYGVLMDTAFTVTAVC